MAVDNQHGNIVPDTHNDNSDDEAATLIHSGVALAVVDSVREQAKHLYALVESQREVHGDVWQLADHLPEKFRYLPSAHSIALEAAADISTLLDHLGKPVLSAVRRQLDGDVYCDIDIAWLRRQFPDASRPAVSKPHAWHQDGAFGFDFSQHQSKTTTGLLSMLTVWIPLHECGLDAPGLEIVQHSPCELLSPDQLDENAINDRYPPGDRWIPPMKPGDVLLMQGHCLHRTHVNPLMSRYRGCMELRFLGARSITGRLSGHRFIPVALSSAL